MSSIIEVKNLRKTFGDNRAVNDISFAVERGSNFAFLGQNGAGKTTTINMIIGLLPRDNGKILYDGATSYPAFKSRMGVVFQNNISDDLLTVRENLQIYGTLYLRSAAAMKRRLSEISDMLSLGDIMKQRFGTLSGGQKRRVEIARALFMSPDILFLDEPTTGLDPKTRADIWAIIGELKNASGMTVFLTTHYMEETATADSVAIINRGDIIATGSPMELKSRYAHDRMLITPQDAGALERQLDDIDIRWEKTADTYTVRINDTERSIDLLNRLRDNIRFFEVVKGTMDDVFLNVVGENPGEGEVGK